MSLPPLFRLAVWLVLGGISIGVQAQAPPDTVDVTAAIERALERIDAPSVSAELVEWLSDRATDPLNINTASAGDLARLPGLTPLSAQRIVAHRTSEGDFTSLAALRNLIGWDTPTLAVLRPFLTVQPAIDDRDAAPRWTDRLDGRLIHRVTRRIDVGRGYSADTTRTTYAGSPARLYTRLHLRTGNRVQMNLTVEKDPGEAFLWSPSTQTYGFDHVTAHVAVQNVGPLKTLIVGDYGVAFGQGVGLWHSFSFSKGRDVISSAVRQGPGLTPFSSTEENRFFRGIGGTVRLTPNLSATAFASRRTLDATTVVDDAGRLVPANRSTSGLHRTPTEQSAKDALREDVAGGIIAWASRGVRLGIAGYHSRTDQPLAPHTASYRRFDPVGPRHATLSTAVSATLGAVYGFAEWAWTEGVWGGIGGVQLDYDVAEAVISVRHYPASFAPLHGRAFGEAGDPPQNETGMYLAARLQPAATWRLSAYFDQYRFPWLRFATPRPTAGYDTRFVMEHTPRPWLTHYVQVRQETRERGTTAAATEPPIASVRPVTRRSVRWHGEYAFSDRLTYRMRVEATHVEDAATNAVGTLLYHGLRWQSLPWLRIDARWTLFDTDAYTARLYAYEHDLLYTFSVPVFSGRGSRHHVLLYLEPTPRFRIELKYGSTRYRGVSTVGSGLDEVEGSRIRDVRAQVRWRF